MNAREVARELLGQYLATGRFDRRFAKFAARKSGVTWEAVRKQIKKLQMERRPSGIVAAYLAQADAVAGDKSGG